MSPDTTNVVKTASSKAHLWPTTLVIELRVGLYTVTRTILVTMRFHLLPRKSCSEVERYGSLNCGSSSSPTRA